MKGPRRADAKQDSKPGRHDHVPCAEERGAARPQQLDGPRRKADNKKRNGHNSGVHVGLDVGKIPKNPHNQDRKRHFPPPDRGTVPKGKYAATIEQQGANEQVIGQYNAGPWRKVRLDRQQPEAEGRACRRGYPIAESGIGAAGPVNRPHDCRVGKFDADQGNEESLNVHIRPLDLATGDGLQPPPREADEAAVRPKSEGRRGWRETE
ncbi:MAG: hypothetical protein ACLFTV_16530, partial [Desulfococcaceae bacterium]